MQHLKNILNTLDRDGIICGFPWYISRQFVPVAYGEYLGRIAKEDKFAKYRFVEMHPIANYDFFQSGRMAIVLRPHLPRKMTNRLRKMVATDANINPKSRRINTVLEEYGLNSLTLKKAQANPVDWAKTGAYLGCIKLFTKGFSKISLRHLRKLIKYLIKFKYYKILDKICEQIGIVRFVGFLPKWCVLEEWLTKMEPLKSKNTHPSKFVQLLPKVCENFDAMCDEFNHNYGLIRMSLEHFRLEFRRLLENTKSMPTFYFDRRGFRNANKYRRFYANFAERNASCFYYTEEELFDWYEPGLCINVEDLKFIGNFKSWFNIWLLQGLPRQFNGVCYLLRKFLQGNFNTNSCKVSEVKINHLRRIYGLNAHAVRW